MDATDDLRKPGYGDGDGEDIQEDVVHEVPVTNMVTKSEAENNSKAASSSPKVINRLELAKAEMGEVREENQRLKNHLHQIRKDYQTLQMQFHGIVHQQPNKPTNASNNPTPPPTHQQHPDESELISLSLGRSNSNDLKVEALRKDKVEDQEDGNQGLALGLDCRKFELSDTKLIKPSTPNLSPENSMEGEDGEGGRPNHSKVTMKRSGDDEEAAQQNPAKKARVSVRVRCDTPTMNDGCQWRKYGQKIAKGNPCPRAYYRCTITPSCPVRKQVQRCAEDMSILITTYEGTHNHPLPISATAMASTTSAAASMLLSGSSTSSTGSATAAAGLHLPNFYHHENQKPRQLYLPNPSISYSPSHPTITLDLTSNPSSSSSSSSHFNKVFTNLPPRYSPTNLNFTSLERTNSLPISWTNGALSYGTQSLLPQNKNPNVGSFNFGNQEDYHFHQQSYNNNNIQKNAANSSNQQLLQPETLAAATKAIASDPNFKSALAAALASIIGGGE